MTTTQHDPAPQGHAAEEHLELVRKVAGRIARRVPRSVELDDLVGAGTVGLMEACRRYDPRGGRSFATYAEFRVKGAMLDELRRQDPLNRATRRRQAKLAAKRAELIASLGREPEVKELAEALDIPEHEADELAAMRVVSVDGRSLDISDEHSEDQEAQLQKKQQIARMREAIGELPPREQLILSLCYLEELPQVAVAKIIGVAESRISQILTKTREQLRQRLLVERPAAKQSGRARPEAN